VITADTLTDERVGRLLVVASKAEDLDPVDLCETVLKPIVQPNLKRQALERIAEILNARSAK
jgi:hypothetical protein